MVFQKRSGGTHAKGAAEKLDVQTARARHLACAARGEHTDMAMSARRLSNRGFPQSDTEVRHGREPADQDAAGLHPRGDLRDNLLRIGKMLQNVKQDDRVVIADKPKIGLFKISLDQRIIAKVPQAIISRATIDPHPSRHHRLPGTRGRRSGKGVHEKAHLSAADSHLTNRQWRLAAQAFPAQKLIHEPIPEQPHRITASPGLGRGQSPIHLHEGIISNGFQIAGHPERIGPSLLFASHNVNSGRAAQLSQAACWTATMNSNDSRRGWRRTTARAQPARPRRPWRR